jgi:hypothetical protein
MATACDYISPLLQRCELILSPVTSCGKMQPMISFILLAEFQSSAL